MNIKNTIKKTVAILGIMGVSVASFAVPPKKPQPKPKTNAVQPKKKSTKKQPAKKQTTKPQPKRNTKSPDTRKNRR